MKRVALAGLLAIPRTAGARTFGLDLPSTPVPAKRDLTELGSKAVVVTLFTMMALRMAADFLATGRVTGLLLVASEGLVVILTLFRRSAATVDRSRRARLLTTLSMIGPPLVRPTPLQALAPEAVTVMISAAGLLFVVAGKVSLGRSFGLMPANRGIVSTGLYRLVRHPIYLGYLVTHVAFAIANPAVTNLLVLGIADAALLMRAVCEEQTLARDGAYREYLQKVRWRMLPGVF
jgi:Isoprenylcysteine carboxyl methyltransferase (ICMT) family